MKNLRYLLLFSAVLCFSTVGVFAQINMQSGSNIVRNNLSQTEIDRIVRNFTNKEGEFRESLKSYVFNRKATIQTVSKLGGQITGEYRRDSFLSIGEDGTRFEKILYSPMSTLTEISITPEDLEDLGGVNPFALDPSVVNLYNFNYVGKEKIDDLDLYVFDVSPKVMPDAKSKVRLFMGRVWVDDRDLMMVKSKGKAVPETKQNKFPVVETWRENVDGKYWFPSYSYADDDLVFDNGQVTRIRMKVSYSDYRLGRSEVRILDDDTPAASNPTPSPTPKKP
ncbi:MAG: hypothetical protein ACR2L1_02760 [Pyrinomonadaceae bacterium]